MNLSRSGMMIILSSPSGAGKTTLVKLLSEKDKNLRISISFTTRIPRNNEADGKDYFFVDEKKFNELVKDGSFYEYAKVFKNFYGTPKKQVIDSLKEGKDVLFDIDWQGTQQIKKQKLESKLISFFILPPSIDELKKRLSSRDSQDKAIVENRMIQFDNDLSHWKDYDYVVINTDLNNCYSEINKIIQDERKGTKTLLDQDLIKRKVLELSR